MKFEKANNEGLSTTLINKAFRELGHKENDFKKVVKSLLKEYPSIKNIFLRDFSGSTTNAETAREQIKSKVEQIKTGFEKEFNKKPPKNANNIIKKVALELNK